MTQRFQQGGTRSPGVRVALYSHDTMGIGHMRRNLLIAQALAGSPLRATVLLVAGAREASTFALPPGVDWLTLPSLHKEPDGCYRSRCLDVDLQRLVNLRAGAIRAALAAFEPDVLIVDKVPRGALGELDLALEDLRYRGRTRCVLGLRDVLDDPEVVNREWDCTNSLAYTRAYYDAIWIYGDPSVYDQVLEYGLPADVAAKVHYTGYLDQRARLQGASAQSGETPETLGLPPGKLVLCAVGGGQDGASLAEAFAEAQLPAQTNGVLLTGPYLPHPVQQRLSEHAAVRSRLRVLPFLAEPEWLLSRADAVIAMGGYNTVCEILSFEKRSLIVPRVRPRREQMIRAERLSRMGLVDVLHPDQMSPAALSAWLAAVRPTPRVHGRVDFGGLHRLPHLVEEVLGRAQLESDGSPARDPGKEARAALAGTAGW